MGLLGACKTLEPQPKPPPFVSGFRIAAYRPFLTPGPLLPFRATGSILVRVGEKVETGKFILAANLFGGISVQILARITGALGLELRFDPERLLLLNYVQKSFFEGPNTLNNRLRLFNLDLSPAEFLMAVTGRVPAAEFEAAEGRLEGSGFAEMRTNGAQYRFALDSHGLPKSWVKEVGAKVVLRVEYRAYLLVPTATGPPLRIPHKIRIYARSEKPAMVLGVSEFEAGATGLERLTFSPPADPGWRFEPLPDPSLHRFKNL